MVKFILRKSGDFTTQADNFTKRLRSQLADLICEKHPKADQVTTVGVDHLDGELTLYCQVDPSCCQRFTKELQMAMMVVWLDYKEEIREQ